MFITLKDKKKSKKKIVISAIDSSITQGILGMSVVFHCKSLNEFLFM